MASNEIAIQSGIIDYLTLKRYFFVRLNNIPPVQTVNGKMVFRRLPKGSVKGLPDLMVMKKGKVIFLEVKDKSKQSPDQILFEAHCKSEQIDYFIVRSIDDVVKVL